MRRSFAAVLPLLFLGCKSAPAPAAPSTESPAPTPSATYPARPTTAPAAFKIFHHGNSSFTLTVNEKAADDELSALVWQLRDTARTHSFDTIHIPQHQVDADGKTVWFHIYRGTKCAPEKYAPGKPPCGASYHAAADYTLDTHSSPPWDKGSILHSAPNREADPHPTQLWDPDATLHPGHYAIHTGHKMIRTRRPIALKRRHPDPAKQEKDPSIFCSANPRSIILFPCPCSLLRPA